MKFFSLGIKDICLLGRQIVFQLFFPQKVSTESFIYTSMSINVRHDDMNTTKNIDNNLLTRFNTRNSTTIHQSNYSFSVNSLVFQK